MAGLLDYLEGIGETGATLGTGLLSGVVGAPYGLFKGITSGYYGSPEAVRIAQEEAKKFMERNTYVPRGKVAQEALGKAAQLMEQSKLPPVLPEAISLSSIPRQAYLAQAERRGMELERAMEPVVRRTLERGGAGADILQQMAQGSKRPLDVWHGTPHKFPPTARNPLGEFDASKIGTGEGAQAYGHGIYTGGNIKTGKEYVKTTARTEVIDSSGNTLYKELPKRKVTGESRAADALDYAFQIQSSNPYAFAANQVRRFGEGLNVQDALKTLEQWEKSGARTRSGGGYLYKADLPDEKIAQMIDWYYPVQEDVRQKVSSAALQKFGSGSTGTSGAHLYAELSKEFERIGVANPKVAASEFLKQQGVPGIKYLDNFSRRQPEWIIQSPQGGQNIFNSEVGALEFLQRNPEGTMIPPSQTYNYVMFPGEEQNIKILQREEFGGLLGL